MAILQHKLTYVINYFTEGDQKSSKSYLRSLCMVPREKDLRSFRLNKISFVSDLTDLILDSFTLEHNFMLGTWLLAQQPRVFS